MNSHMYYITQTRLAGFLLATLLAACGGGSGSGDRTSATPVSAPAAAPIPPPAFEVDRAQSRWVVDTSVSQLTGLPTTTLSLSSADGATLGVTCASDGSRRMIIMTDFITGDGSVSYRIGHFPLKSENWSEDSSGRFRLLTSNAFDIKILQHLFVTWDLVFQLSKFGTGRVNVGMSANGMSAAIDKTRSACNWSTEMFPPDNGWAKPYPSTPPSDAIEATYVTGASQQFSLTAWRDTNSRGQTQILVRLAQDPTKCAGSLLISDNRLYVTQSGIRVAAVSGTNFKLSCASEAATFSLTGDFDASKPLVLGAYPFHYDTLAPGTPISSVVFN